MNIVDSSGWLAYFADEPNAKHFSIPLNATDSLVVPTLTIYEVFKVVLRESSENEALQAAGHQTVVSLRFKPAGYLCVMCEQNDCLKNQILYSRRGKMKCDKCGCQIERGEETEYMGSLSISGTIDKRYGF